MISGLFDVINLIVCGNENFLRRAWEVIWDSKFIAKDSKNITINNLLYTLQSYIVQ